VKTTSARPVLIHIGHPSLGYNTRPHCFLFSHPPVSSPQHEPCLRLTLTLALPLLPTFNPSSMPPWRHMRRSPRSSFSIIPLPPGCSPATPPPPSYLSFKTSSSSLITVGGAMRDYQVGLAQQSTFYTRSRPLLVKVLVSLVSIDYSSISMESVT
jgi:hypothetical protein